MPNTYQPRDPFHPDFYDYRKVAQNGSPARPIRRGGAPGSTSTTTRPVAQPFNLPAPQLPAQNSPISQLFQLAFPQTMQSREAYGQAGDALAAGDLARAMGAGVRGNAQGVGGLAQDVVGLPARLVMGPTMTNPVNSFVEGLFNYQRPEVMAVTPAKAKAQPQEVMSPQQSGMRGPGFQRILQLEGGMDKQGNFKRSPAGAWGPSQLMPGTAPEAMALAGYSRDDQRWKTDANINRQAGQAYFNMLVKKYNGDDVLAAAAYNAGPGRVDKALRKGGPQGWLRLLPAETQNYVKNYGGGQGQLPGWSNPFDAAQPYYNAAMGNIDEAYRAQMTPFSAEFQQAPPPEMPEPTAAPRMDFSETDKMLETLRPVLIEEKRAKQIQRSHMLNGAAQALASLPESAGLGKVLANFGAGLAAGRAAGDAEIQARIDAYDEKTAAFNLLQFKYEGDKAQSLQQSAMQDWQAVNAHNMAKFNKDMDLWARNNPMPRFENGYMVTQTVGPDGKGRVQGTPIAPFAAAARASSMAGLNLRIAGAAQQGASMGAGMDNQILAMGMAQAMSGTVSEEAQASAMLGRAYMLAEDAVASGQAAQIFGQGYTQELEEAMALADQNGLLPGSEERDEFIRRNMTERLMTQMLTVPETRKAMESYSPISQGRLEAQRLRESKRTTTQDSRGRTTVREVF